MVSLNQKNRESQKVTRLFHSEQMRSNGDLYCCGSRISSSLMGIHIHYDSGFFSSPNPEMFPILKRKKSSDLVTHLCDQSNSTCSEPAQSTQLATYCGRATNAQRV